MRVQDATDRNDLVYMLYRLCEANPGTVWGWPPSAIRRAKAIKTRWGKLSQERQQATNESAYFCEGEISSIFQKLDEM